MHSRASADSAGAASNLPDSRCVLLVMTAHSRRGTRAAARAHATHAPRPAPTATTPVAVTAATAVLALTGAGLGLAAPAAQAAPKDPQFVLSSPRDGDEELYLSTAAGGRVPLTANGAGDYGAVWSPDGSRLAFVSDRDGDEEVWVVDADGTDARQLTPTAARRPVLRSATRPRRGRPTAPRSCSRPTATAGRWRSTGCAPTAPRRCG